MVTPGCRKIYAPGCWRVGRSVPFDIAYLPEIAATGLAGIDSKAGAEAMRRQLCGLDLLL